MPLPDGIKIRVARRGDRDSIYRLMAEVGVNVAPYDQSNTLSWIVSHPEIEVLVAVDPLDRGVGMISLSHRPSLRVGGRVATVDALIVTAAMRRKGIGAELLGRSIERARMLGCKQVEIPSNDTGSREWLRRRGFVTEAGTLSVWENPLAK